MKRTLATFLFLTCGLAISAQECTAKFVMTGSGNKCGSGYFTVRDVTGTKINIGDASSGWIGMSNNARTARAKDIGSLPQGKYMITLKTSSSNKFRLNPLPGTKMYSRNGMLIHGYKSGQSREEASTGCIILDNNQRRKLRQYFNECGEELELTVSYR